MPRPALTQARCLTYWLTGPALISNYDVAAVLSKLLGRTITYRELTFEENGEQGRDHPRRGGRPVRHAQRQAVQHEVDCPRLAGEGRARTARQTSSRSPPAARRPANSAAIHALR
jgi:hypothetical protein